MKLNAGYEKHEIRIKEKKTKKSSVHCDRYLGTNIISKHTGMITDIYRADKIIEH